MGPGGTAKTDDDAASIIVALIKENEALGQAAKKFLEAKNITDKDLKDIKDVKEILGLLEGQNGIDFLSTIIDNLSYDKNKNTFIRTFGQNPNMAQKADTLGKNIAIGAAVIVAIALIALAIYNRKAISENIKDGAKYVGEKVKDIGEGVMHLLKNFIDMLSTGQSNAVEYVSNCYVNNDTNNQRIAKGEPLPDDAAFIKQYLLNEDGFKALENFIKAEVAAGRKIKLEGTDIELTVESLKRLKEKGDSKRDSDNAGLREELSKFKLIMSGANEHIRKEVEAEQDKIHTDKKLETPLPSSALYPGSNANTEFLLQIPETIRKDVKNLLEKASGFTKPFREGDQGLYQELDKLCKGLKGDSCTLDSSVLEGNDSSTLTTLAKGLKDFTSDDITLLINGINTLQSQGQKTGMSQVQLTSVKSVEQEI